MKAFKRKGAAHACRQGGQDAHVDRETANHPDRQNEQSKHSPPRLSRPAKIDLPARRLERFGVPQR